MKRVQEKRLVYRSDDGRHDLVFVLSNNDTGLSISYDDGEIVFLSGHIAEMFEALEEGVKEVKKILNS